MPQPLQVSYDNSGEVGSTERNATSAGNLTIQDVAQFMYAFQSSAVLSWNSAAANSSQGLGRGSTDTSIASGAVNFTIQGVPASKTAVTTGTAPNADTVTADLWTAFAFDIVAAGTITVVSPGTTTGYTTEAAAIAGIPPRLTVKARLGIVSVKTKAATAWVGATDAFAGGSSGNVASVTNYYPNDGVCCPTGVASQSDMTPYTGGRNGITTPTVLARGSSTDTNLGNTAFLYNARGICDINKTGNTTTATALGALGTIPASKWGLIVMYISSVGTFSFQSAPSNYTTGYGNEGLAKNDLPVVPQPANLARVGYITILASASTFVVGTDALAGGSSGNPATITNYYPQAGIALGVGQQAALVANMASPPTVL